MPEFCFECSHCASSQTVRASARETSMKCPDCGKTIVVPMLKNDFGTGRLGSSAPVHAKEGLPRPSEPLLARTSLWRNLALGSGLLVFAFLVLLLWDFEQPGVRNPTGVSYLELRLVNDEAVFANDELRVSIRFADPRKKQNLHVDFENLSPTRLQRIRFLSEDARLLDGAGQRLPFSLDVDETRETFRFGERLRVTLQIPEEITTPVEFLWLPGIWIESEREAGHWIPSLDKTLRVTFAAPKS